jgi:DNA-directed RNA polymerase subunit RPC12/RpoP
MGNSMGLTQAIYESLMEEKVKILKEEAKNPCPECGGKITVKSRYNCAGKLRYFKHCLCTDSWKKK